jgi:hypothetical protein
MMVDPFALTMSVLLAACGLGAMAWFGKGMVRQSPAQMPVQSYRRRRGR